VRGFVLVLLAALIFLASGAAAARADQLQTPRNQLQVWNFNTAALSTGPITDYRKFVDYITDPGHVIYMPDLITLQEVGTNISGSLVIPSCHVFEQTLEAKVPGQNYYCVETTYRGGDAVLWRTPRLIRESVPGHPISDGKSVLEYVRDTTTGPCFRPTNPTANNWWAMAVRLKDTADAANPRYVNAASFHLRTTPGNPAADCAWENMKLLNTELADLPAHMRIMAGDANHGDATVTNHNNTFLGWECWYDGTNADLAQGSSCSPNIGWKDVMYRKWLGSASTTMAQRYGNLHTFEWSFKSPSSTDVDRRDFIFTKTYSISMQLNSLPQTPRWEDAYPYEGNTQIPYSDHRGQGALMTYCASTSSCSTGAAP
jgi:hypothetical protein